MSQIARERQKDGLPEETRKKISATLKAKGIRPPVFDGWVHCPEETRKHKSEAMKIVRRDPVLEAQRNLKNSQAQRGKVVSAETRERISIAGTGAVRSPEFKANLSCIFSAKYQGAGNPMWNGGSSFLPYPPVFNEALKESIRQRDGYICQRCGMPQNHLPRRLFVHHKDRDKNNNLPENLVSICLHCNGEVHPPNARKK